MSCCIGWDHGPAGAYCHSPTLGQRNAARPCPSASHLPWPLGVSMIPAICTAASGNEQPMRCAMARTPTVTRDQVPEPLRAAFDAETAGSGGTVRGPRLRQDVVHYRASAGPVQAPWCRPHLVMLCVAPEATLGGLARNCGALHQTALMCLSLPKIFHIPTDSYANPVSGWFHAVGVQACLHGQFSGRPRDLGCGVQLAPWLPGATQPWDELRRPLSSQITSAISTVWNFTTQSGGIWSWRL